ncbi:MAG: hypothetical protein LBE13_01680 [Bacteroidales bacterium]|jgi:UPF0716 family protein affecting phage T7 exclusion|nr:hypothetical protein [Bacteroidales bacterium]
MTNFINALAVNTVFQLIAGICSIVGAMVGILAIIPFTREKFFSFKQNIRIDEQSINGSGNMQAGGNIHGNTYNKDGSDFSAKQTTRINVGKQQISGNNNSQAGGDING